MLVRSIGHACIAVETAGKRLLCDPWWSGAAYTNQWHAYPPPRPEPDDQRPDFIYLSHGHEDHMHIPTLRRLDRAATLVIPRYRDTGMRDFLGTLGFARIIEIGHGQTRTLATGLDATIWLNKEDSVLVIESEGRTLVNANDALHASPRHVIDHLCAQIRKRHSRVDTLLLGFGGAAWFPNCMNVTDAEPYDATTRERIFTENFAYTAQRLDARMALPFAASFVLLEDHLRWINEMRFRAASPCEELRRQGAGHIRTHFLMPGDRILGDQILALGERELEPAAAIQDIERRFTLEIAALHQHQDADHTRLERLRTTLKHNSQARAARVLKHGDRLLCRIDVRDVPEWSFLVDCSSESVEITRCERLRLAPLVLSARLEVLESWATQEYGYEAITIGYGATLQARRRDLALRGPLIALLGRKPLPPTRAERLAQWLQHPWRCFDSWWRDLHWERLAFALKHGQVQRWNDVYAMDPERWSPLREHPLPRRRSA